jgi:chorismate synthase
MQAVSHAGGLTAGAYQGRRLVGFVHGIPRTNLDEPCQHSHMLAVVPRARGRGLAVRLKLFQRRWCLDRGIRLVTWTYDPLIVKNAHLNLVRLKARACAYHRNLYGPLGGIYGPLPSDRFEVWWRLDDPAVAAAARKRPGETADAEELPRVTGRRLPSGRRLAVEIPLGAPGFFASDPTRASRERLRLRRIASALLAKGYQATSLQVLPGSALYVFERQRRARGRLRAGSPRSAGGPGTAAVRS